jgi:hypothetical protein
MEIVGHDDRLMFRTTEEAVERICAVLASPSLQAVLCSDARLRSEMYASERFVARMREIVADFPNAGASGRDYVAAGTADASFWKSGLRRSSSA